MLRFIYNIQVIIYLYDEWSRGDDVGNGGASYIAICIGADRKDEAEHILTIGFELIVMSGIVLGILGIMFINPIFTILGAKNYKRMKELIKSGTMVTTIIELFIMMIFGVFASNLIGIFTESKEVIDIGTITLRAFLLMLPFVGATSIVRNTFNAMGKPMFAFGITIVRQLILYIPFLLIFNKVWGYPGLIHAQPTEEFVCMIFSLWLMFRYLKKYEE